MLAAAIGVDRAVEGDVRRLVAGDDPARLLDLHVGLQRRQLFERAPVVVEGLDDLRLVAAGDVGLRATPRRRSATISELLRPVRPAPAQADAGHRDGVGETTCGDIGLSLGAIQHTGITKIPRRTLQEQIGRSSYPPQSISLASGVCRQCGMKPSPIAAYRWKKYFCKAASYRARNAKVGWNVLSKAAATTRNVATRLGMFPAGPRESREFAGSRRK